MTIKRIIRIMSFTLLALLLMIVTFGYFVGRRHFVVHEQTFYFTDLPKEFDGYKILQFSDIHAGAFTYPCHNDLDTIIALVNSQKCDAIFFLGDIICRNSHELDKYDSLLRQLKAPDGVYSIMGNHDYGTYAKFDTEAERLADIKTLQQKQRNYGWRLLLNENVKIRRGRSHIAVVGIENDGEPPFPSLADIPKAAKGLKKSDFCILLSHDPTKWKSSVVGHTSFQLTLSGHTHGGQVKLFGWTPSATHYPYWSGAYVEGNQMLNVTEGVGCSLTVPFRFGAWPEVNVITLKKLEK